MKNTHVTSDRQVRAIVEVAMAAARKSAQDTAKKLTTAGRQRVLAHGDVLASDVVRTVKTKMCELAEQAVGHLRLVSGDEVIIIDAADGYDMIAKAKDTFSGWIDPKFVSYGTNVEGKPTKATLVQVYEMIKDGTLAQSFGGFGENLDRLCLSQGQIIQFCRNQTKWLRADSYTFFLFKVDKDYFVVNVYWSLAGLKVTVGRLSNDHGWRAAYRHRFVVPQL